MNDLPLGIHTWFMIIPFGLLLPLGIVVSRWRDPEPSCFRKLRMKRICHKWLDMHVILNVTSSICIFFSFTIGYFYLGTHTYKTHQYLGVISACLVILQPLNGWFRAKKKSDLDIPDNTFLGNPKRWAWEKFHYTSGGCLVLTGWINCVIGAYIVPLDSLWLFLFLIPAFISILWLVLMCPSPSTYTHLESVKLEDGEENTILIKK